MVDEDDGIGSEPCFAHLLVDGHVVDPQTRKDVARFRKSERERLYGLRKAVPFDERRAAAELIAEWLDRRLGDVAGISIAVYWPIRGELDLRGWMKRCSDHGAITSLPVVVEPRKPVAFHQWTPACRMRPGFWKIPVPQDSRAVTPDIVIVPLLGVDEARFRLGNGGGYYDRTLAILPKTAVAIGVGHGFLVVKTIFPMPWDIPMDEVILGDGTVF